MVLGGMAHAPVTKSALVGSIIVSTWNIFSPNPRVFTLQEMADRPSRLARLLTLPWMYFTSGELLFASVLLYMMRMFERHWGSHKFAVYTVASVLTSTALQLAIMVGLRSLSITSSLKVHWRGGPYGLIYALLYRYFLDIPAISPFSIFNVRFSDKFLVYVVALQFMLMHSPSSIVAAVSGLLAGVIISSPTLGIRRWKFPRFITSFFQRSILPVIDGPVRGYSVTRPMQLNPNALHQTEGIPTQLMGNQAPQPRFIPQQNQQAAAAAHAAPRAAPAPPAAAGPPVPESAVTALSELGFERQAIIAALRATNNNVDEAAQILFAM